MKKLSLILIAILAFMFICNAQENKFKVRLGYLTANFDNPSYVNGKLKEMTQISYEAKLVEGKITKGEKIKNSEVLNNRSLNHITYKFNQGGEMISSTLYDDNGNSDWLAIIYNEEGKIRRFSFFHKDTLKQYNRLIYDNLGLKEIIYYLPESDKVTGKSVYQCDKNGIHFKMENFTASGVKTNETEIVRDEMGRIHFATYKNRDGLITNKVEYLYGSHFDPISQNTKTTNGKEVNISGKREFTYDKNGNWIQLIRYKDDQPQNITERTYTFY